MPILPIDDGRYANPKMARIFEEDTRIQKMLDVEAALAWAHAEVGNIPRESAEKIAAMASLEHVKLSRLKEIEQDTKHEVVALVRVLAEACGASGAYVHLGATSSDITDTAMALQLKAALGIIERRISELSDTFKNKVSEFKKMASIIDFRHAPILSTLDLVACIQEFSRHSERLKACKGRVVVGKMSGAVGTQAAFGVHADEIQQIVMRKLGIKAAEISTQIVQRDRYAELVCLLAVVAASLENVAAAIAHGHIVIGKVAKMPKAKEGARMPSQEIVEKCETICGIAKLVRSLVVPALENITTWHERDLTQSSAERFIIPQTCILVDYLLFLTNCLVNNLAVSQ